jgi:proteasome lid subunit RPN8/RPN11
MAELDPNTSRLLVLAKAHRDEMIDSAQRVFPQEACGIIAGRDQVSNHIIPITNILASRTAYQMDPKELVAAFWDLDESGLEAIAFFHSHPHSPPIPSPTDLRSHLYPEIPQIILGKPADEWILRAYLLIPKAFLEIPLKII